MSMKLSKGNIFVLSGMCFCFMNQTLFQFPTENLTNPQHNSNKQDQMPVCSTVLTELVSLVGVSDFLFVICSYENKSKIISI